MAFALLLTALTLVVIIPIVGLTVDGAIAFAVKAKLSTSCDAARPGCGAFPQSWPDALRADRFSHCPRQLVLRRKYAHGRIDDYQ